MNPEAMIGNAREAGILIASGAEKKLSVRGTAFVRKISCEVEWEETNRETGELKKYSSVISSLGWQWERHWNVYTEEAPFGLMLSQLFDFLRSCIACNSYFHSYIEWGWDETEFYLISIKPAGDHRWHRCLYGKYSASEPVRINSRVDGIVAGWSKDLVEDKEKLFVKYEDAYRLNCDYICAKRFELGIGGGIAGSPHVRPGLAKRIRYLPALLKIYRSRKELRSIIDQIIGSNRGEDKTFWEDTGEKVK